MTERPNMDNSANKCSKFRAVLRQITVEPVIPLYVLTILIMQVPLQNLDLDKSCRVNLRLKNDVCDALINGNATLYTQAQEDMVQKEVTTMLTWKNVIKGLIPACPLIVIGAWSDTYNLRKVMIGLPIIGRIISMCGLLLCVYFFNQLPMEASGIFDVLPSSLSGGISTFVSGIFSYCSSTSTIETRTIKLGVAKILFDLSNLLGVALGGILYRTIGLYGIFSLVLLCLTVGIIYLVTVVKETTMTYGSSYLEVSKCEVVKDFFNFKLAKPTFMVACKRRKSNFRARIFVVLILFVLTMGPVYGENEVIYLSTRKRFNWSEIEYSVFRTLWWIVQFLGAVCSIYLFSKHLKLSDPMVGMICYTGKLFAVCLFAFAKVPWVMGMGIVLDALSSSTTTMLLSMGTKFVSKDEIGKLLSLIGILDSLLPLIGGFSYTVVYNKTLHILPGAFYLIGGVMWIPSMSLLGWLYVQQKRDSNGAPQEEEEAQEVQQLIKH